MGSHHAKREDNDKWEVNPQHRQPVMDVIPIDTSYWIGIHYNAAITLEFVLVIAPDTYRAEA